MNISNVQSGGRESSHESDQGCHKERHGGEEAMLPSINCQPWVADKQNAGAIRLLIIRYNCFGDLLATFPYINSLKQQFGDRLEIDLMVCDFNSGVAEHLTLFDRVIKVSGGFHAKRRFLSALSQLPYMLSRRYDAVIDLQNNKISQIIRRALGSKPFSEFDKTSARPAGIRYQHTINALGLADVELYPHFELRESVPVDTLLRDHGWQGGSLVILNPAGAYENRHWPVSNYIDFARLWLDRIDSQSQFLFVGQGYRIGVTAQVVAEALGEKVINLADKTTQIQAFQVVQKAELMLSEDSGLMHMAWVNGIKTIAMLGSTRADWTQPLGEQVDFFSSSDLPCGDCMQPTCEHGDNRCMTRITPSMVLAKYCNLPEPAHLKEI